MTRYETFLQLHYKRTPLLIGNVWDVVSAKIFEAKGFEAIATSSAAVAHTMGYEDGEHMPFNVLLQMVERISQNVSIPLSVDMEGGYSRSIPGIVENVEKLYEMGVVGINIEDSSKENQGQQMAVDDFKHIISSIANHLSAKNMNMFINARTDAFIHKLPSPVTETMARAKAYENAGANGIFVPFLQEEEDIKSITHLTSLPVSVFSTSKLPSFERLGKLGVRRISMGRAVHKALAIRLEKMITIIQQEQSFESLYL